MYLTRSLIWVSSVIFIVVHLTYGLSENEYVVDNGETLHPDEFKVHFISLTKRESEPQPVLLTKKATEKKIQPKGPLKDNSKEYTKEISTTTSESPKITESKNETNLSTTTPSYPVTSDLPSDLPKNYTIQDVDGETNSTQHYIFYNATFYNENATRNLWVDLDSLSTEKVITHTMLSSSHRRAATIPLPFDFPFYGHKIRNITIATGGFLYTGDYMHTWLAATQYIAPLMANFDTSIHNDSTIKYADNGENFTVQWDRVYLQDKSQGPFTFQVTLYKSGDIAFVYKTVPVSTTSISDDSHPVKVGLSDAYIVEKMVVFIRRKTIYEYHRVDASQFDIQNNTAVYFTALPTCQNISTCEDCQHADTSFECTWCEAIGRCSSGLDRHRQDWLAGKCDELKPKDVKCKAPTPAPIPTKPSTDKKPLPTSTTPPSSKNTSDISSNVTEAYVNATTYIVTSAPQPSLVTLSPGSKGQSISADPAPRVYESSESQHNGSVGPGAVIAILIIICSVLGFGMWIGYAYKYPQSPSGQLLIRYRPSQWRWRHGEARYTAASIHI